MDNKSTMKQVEASDLIIIYHQKMLENYHSMENLVITPKNVFQEGIRYNYNIFMELVDRLMLPGSCVKGAKYLINTLTLIKQKKSILFLMKHIGNFDVPCFYSLLSKEGEQYQQILDRLVFIAGRKLNEDSLLVKTFSEIFSRLVIVPNREIPIQTDHETPEQKSYRETIENEATLINRAAFRKMINLKKEGRIIVLFPMGGRPKSWLKEKGVKETTSYMRLFDYVQFIKMEGNLLPVGREMKEEHPQRDKIIFTISDAVLAKDYLEESHRLFEEQTKEMDFDQFNVNRLMGEIGQSEVLKVD